MSRTGWARIPRLVLAIGLCEAAGGLGALATRDALITWYPTLKKPSFNPPNEVFGPVWSSLYLMMGIALEEVSAGDAGGGSVRLAQGLFGLQLSLNTAWSLIFFGLRSPRNAFFEIVVLWTAIVATIGAFYRVSRRAAFLLVPYLLWTTFAAALNFSIWRLNRTASK